MSLLEIKYKVVSLLFSHSRAEELIDARLDEALGEGRLFGADADWLDDHLSRCMRCSEALSARRAMMEAMRSVKGVSAPPGFAGRVVFAARARGREQDRASDPITEHRLIPRWGRPLVPTSQLAMGVMLLVLVAGTLGTLVIVGPKGATGEKSPAAPLTGGTSLHTTEMPHFVVRAPGIGAAKARSQVTAIVRAHGGSFADVDGALLAHIPRSELIRVTQDLASQGRYKMSKADAAELPAALEVIAIRFELE